MKNKTKNTTLEPTGKNKNSSAPNKPKYVAIDATVKITMELKDWLDLLFLLDTNTHLPVSRLLGPDIKKILDNAKKEYGGLCPLVQ